MKKSLIEAKKEAYDLSVRFPDTAYYVMDKSRCKPRVHNEAIVNNPVFKYDLMRQGYYPCCVYRNGVESWR